MTDIAIIERMERIDQSIKAMHQTLIVMTNKLLSIANNDNIDEDDDEDLEIGQGREAKVS